MCSVAPTAFAARFLDLEPGDGQTSIRLIYSQQLENVSPSMRYVALSHCWGASTKAPFRTTKANHDDNLKGIPLTALPRTFRDAIRVVKAIGVRFMWIDSLCIVQDDKDDWADEAAKMADIYRGSYFTIAATSSPNGDGGLFLESLTSATAVHIGGHGNTHTDATDATNTVPLTCFIRHPIASRKAIWDAPLSQRAWVLQEQVLAPRLIHFTEHQMYYQCHLGLESEDGTIKDDSTTSLRGASTMVVGEGEVDMGLRDLSTPVHAVETWWTWVAEYSSRSLTFHTDRIAAVAGLVKHYQSSTGKVPLLGLWAETLWYDLAWQVNSDVRNQSESTGRISAKCVKLPLLHGV
ncbi:hypothetical protein DL767_001188 [Monosporascus sp. MG133]|nr:hypothetical protein DL767_001188 [Monosporascus sp. MG133]